MWKRSRFIPVPFDPQPCRLLRERTRCKALEDELQTPLNVHRWRKLEGRCVMRVVDMFMDVQASAFVSPPPLG